MVQPNTRLERATVVDFIYLVQGTRQNVKNFEFLQKTNSRLVTLTYDSDFDLKSKYRKDNIFLPNSTWAEGRNRLLSHVKNEDYKYLVFMDDDAQISKESLDKFESQLLEYSPKIGIPISDQIRDGRLFTPRLKVQRPVALDQIVQAFSKEAVNDSIVIPYVVDFDNRSWWLACEINQYLIINFYSDTCLQFNEIFVKNGEHTWLEQNKNPFSLYKSGKTYQDIVEIKEFIQKRHSPVKKLNNTLFHKRLHPKVNHQWKFKYFSKECLHMFNEGNYLGGFKMAIKFMQNTLVVIYVKIIDPKSLIQVDLL